MREGAERVQMGREMDGVRLRPALRAMQEAHNFDPLPAKAIDDKEGKACDHQLASTRLPSGPTPFG